jgi:glycosyltransferase involved in cell wall biosynthesis
MKVSIIIRTLNEEKYLPSCLEAIKSQDFHTEIEIIVVDSGSNDRTLEICAAHNVEIIQIKKSEFTYGRALNIGCDRSQGGFLVFLSAHCIPNTANWLNNLTKPLFENKADYVYGSQRGRLGVNTLSECRDLIVKYQDTKMKVGMHHYINNSNAAIKRDVWRKFKFNEIVLGREDLVLALTLQDEKFEVDYTPSAQVEHLHYESWAQIKNRFLRETIVESKLIGTNLSFNMRAMVTFLRDIVYDASFGVKHATIPLVQIISYRTAEYSGRISGSKGVK